MDLAEAGAQGLALAVASGALFGAAGQSDNPGLALAAAAAVVGAFLYGISLTPEDHPAWPGWVVGAPVALLAYFALRDVAAVASARAGEGGAGGVAFLIAVFALALAGISLIGPLAFVGIVAFLAVVYLFFSRRKRASEKHAGLRSLR
ncbi:MAG: hypothetical protein M3331_02625 [Actinomycetota bacterium]|nr:hypothetical protein [Actinomycetota bacterium]